MEIATAAADVTLDDKYRLERGVALMSGTQALVRLPILQRQRDAKAGLRTAGFISGYRGSPIGGYDRELWRATKLLDENKIVFRPGLNEDLAATAVWGTQQIGVFPNNYDGVFALWYGKGPGVERSGDVFKHGHYAGAARSGGVLIVAADDPAAKSSTIAQQSEATLAAHHIPVLYPASVGEILEFGLLGWALSRYSGLWVGLRCVNETLETDVTVILDEQMPRIVLPPALDLPPEGVNFRGAYGPVDDERLLTRYRLPLAAQFARANRLDRAVFETLGTRLGIVSAGKTYSDVLYALRLLGIDAERARSLRLDVYKLGMIWPVETSGLREFASHVEELLVIEEKRPFIESQVTSALYGAEHRPRISGKHAAEGTPLLPSDGTLTPSAIALVIAARLERCGMGDAELRARVADLEPRVQIWAPARGRATAKEIQSGAVRTPYFCSGCPHNTSTRVPDGSRAFSGIGCHTMALIMGRNTLPPTHMGGEGANWIGIAPFVETPHVFQNMGDGTYFHSGLLAIRAAVAAKINITYKILYNSVVAMTGGQPIDGTLSVPEIARQVVAEGISRCVIVTVAPEAHESLKSLSPEVTVYDRDDLDAVQRRLRDVPGVTVLIYEQMCAAEKRRQIKRKLLPAPTKRVFINESVCEGCGDCSAKSNCVSVLPKETPLGRKRMIDQSACNEDLSCVKGFCPSFVLVRNARPRPRSGNEPVVQQSAPAATAPLSTPPAKQIQGAYNVMITGIGGTGVITVGAVLAMAARLEGKGASTYNMTGLAQKNGPVYSHLSFSAAPEREPALRIEAADADLVLACDVLAGLAPEAFDSIRKGHTRAVINSGVEPTAGFQLFGDAPLPGAAHCDLLVQAVGSDHANALDATGMSVRMLGDKIAANLVLVGYALQKRLLPLRLESIERAIELNNVAVELSKRAVELGRRAALMGDPQTIEPRPQSPASAPNQLECEVALGQKLLAAYQNEAYAEWYTQRVRDIATVESTRSDGKTGLALAVARNYRKLLAYKDEYEVARLYADPALRCAIEEAFEGSPHVSVLLAPPFLSGAPGPDGNPRKREFGPWIFPLFRLLARLKGLRGTRLDPFGYTAERRLERKLIREYEGWLDAISESLSPSTHEAAVGLASVPEQIRGYGSVKLRSVSAARKVAADLLTTIRALARTDPKSPRCHRFA